MCPRYVPDAPVTCRPTCGANCIAAAHVCSGGELLAQPSRRIVEVDADSLIGRIF